MDSGKVFLLTGCASGIGKHLTSVLVQKGYRVCATDINFAGLEKLSHEWNSEKVKIRKLDVSSMQSWQESLAYVTETWGRIDVLINIAGYLLPGFVNNLSETEIHKHIDINTKGVIFGTKIAAEKMIKQKSGHIINISSLAGIAPIPGLSLYSASKFAVRAFSLAAAEELSGYGISVTVVCPDAVQTPMLDLQANYQEAAITFSGSAFLTVEDVEKAVFKALTRKPREIVLPFSRGVLAKAAGCFANLSGKLTPLLRKKGLKRQGDVRRK